MVCCFSAPLSFTAAMVGGEAGGAGRTEVSWKTLQRNWQWSTIVTDIITNLILPNYSGPHAQGIVLYKGVCDCVLSTFWKPVSENPLPRMIFPCKLCRKTPSKNPSEHLLQSPSGNPLLRTLLQSVSSCDPLSLHPFSLVTNQSNIDEIIPTEFQPGNLFSLSFPEPVIIHWEFLLVGNVCDDYAISMEALHLSAPKSRIAIR